MEFSGDNNYQNYTTVESGKEVSYSCVSLANLIKKGFYKKDQFVNKDIDINKTVVQVKVVDGVESYELITDYNVNSHCN